MANKILAVAHTKGGVGKSTILNQIAIYFLKLGINIRVADSDPNKVTTFLSKRRQKDKKLKTFESTVIKTKQELEDFCKIPFDGITFIDTAGVDCILTRTAIEIANMVITPITPSTTEFIGFATYKKVVESLKNIEKNKIKMIVNQVHPRCNINKDYSYFKQQLKCDFDFLKTNIIRVSEYDTSLAQGKGVVEIDENTSASIRIKFIVHEIIGLLELKNG